MKRILNILIATLLVAFAGNADITADWKIHMPFDEWPQHVVETPNRVYFMSRTFEYTTSVPERMVASHSLYYYDKKGDEIISVNEGVQSNGNAVACINYNSKNKYLLVVYTDCNIDFMYDDGRVFNLPALKIASIPGKKEANYITFDHQNNRAYVATSFGYICLNDQKHEVAESRNYGVSVESVGRCGDNMVLCIDGQIYFAPVSEQRFNLDEYTVLEGAPVINYIVPSYHDHFYGYTKDYNAYLELFNWEDGSYTWETSVPESKFFGIQEVENGHRLTGYLWLYFIGHDGDISRTKPRPNSEGAKPAASYNGTELWTLTGRKGLRSYKNTETEWVLSRDYMKPNAPASYISSSTVYHPTYGMLVGSAGYDFTLSDFNQETPTQISALKGGFWKEYSPLYTNPDILPLLRNYVGLAVDPSNNNYVYRSNTLGGLLRINLSNPNDVLVMANPSNRYASLPQFVKIQEDQVTWNMLCRFTTPTFTPDGTMWTLHANHDEGRGEIWYWPAADRAATTSAATYRPMKKIPVPQMKGSNEDIMTSLSKNRNILAISAFSGSGNLMFYDHNGTPEVTSDDRCVVFNNPYDQDGGTVSFLRVNALKEDPESGMLWVMTQRGLFTVNPATAFDNPNLVNRIKVARNDGTNLADYLLNEINVLCMAVDGEGRKWFGTSSGLVCTSADGRTILGEFTTDNSLLPDDTVYTLCYNQENNSMMVGTGSGLVEMFPSGSGGAVAGIDTSFRVYPNPVEPDYYGWVRIDNVADGSLVKITDAGGGLVKEFGPVQGGSVEWDVSGLNNSRVSTGVYYIMVSPGSTGGKTEISKILVLN